MIIIVIAAGIYLIMRSSNSPTTGAPQSSETGATSNYTNSTHHFSLSYPNGLGLKPAEFAADQGDYVTIADAKTGTGMQIYITPFNEDLSVLTAARIKQDAPDLQIVSPQDVTVGQSGKGVAFFDGTGDSANRQIWFVVGKELYQITAPKSFDQTLQGIMNTWAFTQFQ